MHESHLPEFTEGANAFDLGKKEHANPYPHDNETGGGMKLGRRVTSKRSTTTRTTTGTIE